MTPKSISPTSTCLWCDKRIKQSRRFKENGRMKWTAVVSSLCCSSKCSDRLTSYVLLVSHMQDVDQSLIAARQQLEELEATRPPRKPERVK